MKITLPSVEYKNISVPSYQETPSENELILFFEENNQIAVMNETSTCIWQFIVNSAKENANENITVKVILNHLHKHFDMEAQDDNDITNDIVDIVKEFISKKMIVCNE